MHHYLFFISGIGLLGFLLPECLAAIGKARIPMAMNIYCSIACMLIAYAFVAP